MSNIFLLCHLFLYVFYFPVLIIIHIRHLLKTVRLRFQKHFLPECIAAANTSLSFFSRGYFLSGLLKSINYTHTHKSKTTQYSRKRHLGRLLQIYTAKMILSCNKETHCRARKNSVAWYSFFTTLIEYLSFQF